MGIYDKYKKLILPLTTVKTQVTTALPGVIGKTVTTGLGNEGIDLAIWINEKLQDDTITIPGLAELIQLTGMPEGSSTLGSFNGNIIPDNSTIKQALQILETAVMGAGGGSGLNGIYTGSGDIAANVIANVNSSFSINTGNDETVKIGDINGVVSNDFNSINGIGLEINTQGYVKLGKVFSQTGYAPSVSISKDELALTHDYNNYILYTSTEFPVLKTDKTQFTIWGAYPNFKGLVYKNDYSNNYVDRSLVDKAYVDLKAQIVADGDKGDITLSNNGSVWILNNNSVTYSKLQNVTSSKLLGRYDATTGTVQEISLGAGLAFVNNTLISTGGSGGILLTTNNSSGPATLNSGTLNIPNYSLTGLGGVPTTRTITINGESYDLSQNRSWTINSMIYPSAGIPISTGTAWGSSIVNNSTNWNTAYSWGNHATQGYLTSLNLNGLTDVTIGTLNNGQILQYNSTTSQWENVSITIGSGDMQKSVYDTDNDGVVDYAESIPVVVRNNSSTNTLYRGTIVYLSGSTGNRPNAFKAQANSEATSSKTFGVVINDINPNNDGLVAAMGSLHNLDTRTTATNPFTSVTLADGDNLWLDPNTAGYVTNVKPSAPNHVVFIGVVARTSPTNGSIVYKIQNGYEIEELHNVNIIDPLTNNQVLRYNSSNSLWENKTLNFQVPLTLTTTGTSGAATLAGDGVLNIPNYSTAPGGNNTEVQFNNSGAFGGSSKLTWDGTNLKLSDVIQSSPSISFNSIEGTNTINQTTVKINNITFNDSPSQYRSSLIFNSYNNVNGYGSTPLAINTVYNTGSNTFVRNEILLDGTVSITNIPTSVSTASGLIGITTGDGLFKTSLDASTLSLSNAGVLSGVIKTLNDLTDVVAPSPTTNQFLRYNGTNWVNQTLTDIQINTSSLFNIRHQNANPAFAVSDITQDVFIGSPSGANYIYLNNSQSLTVAPNTYIGDSATPSVDSNAILTLDSNSKGLLLPRLTTTQINSSLGSATDGMMVYDSTTMSFKGRANGVWGALGSGGGTPGGSTTQIQFNDDGSFAGSNGFTYDKTALTNTGQVNIGDPSSPTGRFNVKGGGTLTTVNTRLTNSSNVELFSVLDNGTTSIGNPAVTAKLNIKGDGATSSTTSLSIKDSGNSQYLSAADNGTIALGKSFTISSPTTYRVFSGGPTITNTVSGGLSQDVGFFVGGMTYAGSEPFFGARAMAFNANNRNTSTSNQVWGAYFVAQNETTTSRASSLRGVEILMLNNSTGGTITDAQGLTIKLPTHAVGSTITNTVGLLIDDLTPTTAGTQTNVYSIQSTDALARMTHAGNASFGTYTSSARLHVQGENNLSTSSALLVQNNDTIPANLLDVRNDGMVSSTGHLKVSGTSGSWVIQAEGTSNSGGFRRIGNNIEVTSLNTITSFVGRYGSLDLQGFAGGSTGNAAGSSVTISNTFNFNADSANTKALSITPTINQISTGSFTLLHLNPTINTTGSSLNYLLWSPNIKLLYNGDVLIGATTSSARLHVRGENTTAGVGAFLVQNSTPDDIYKIENNGKITYWATNTAAGTTAPQTIDKPSGTINFAAADVTKVVTNALCTTSSIVFATVRTNDATAYIKNVVPGSGSFTIELGAAATAETSVGFFIIN